MAYSLAYYHLYRSDTANLWLDFLLLIHVRYDRKCLHQKTNMLNRNRIAQATVLVTLSRVARFRSELVYYLLFLSEVALWNSVHSIFAYIPRISILFPINEIMDTRYPKYVRI